MPLECPANYFGKGEDYLLSDDPKELAEFNRRFEEWERAHPEDPSGDIALAHDKIASSSSVEHRHDGTIATEEKKTPAVKKTDETLKELEMVMPESYIKRFKELCQEKRKRPRDMMMIWIDKYSNK